MANDFNTNTKNNDEWLTPLNIIEGLGEFDLDPCSPIVRPWDTAAKHYNINDDGFNQPWEGRVWCNPPYGRETFKWIDKLATHGNGTALIFARTETIGFHEHIWSRADAIFFF
jgi:DNA N-6-adenine-methyltransferase (Dam)